MIHVIQVDDQDHSPPVVSEAVGPRYARAWIERRADHKCPQEGSGTCDSGRLSIHVPAPQGPAPTAGQETLFSVSSV